MNQSKYLEVIYQVISSAFCVIVVLSNIISAKMIKLSFFHELIIPAGLLTYPFTFLLSNLVTEIYGKFKARLMVYIAFGVNLLALAIIQIALLLPGSISEENTAFQIVMGLGGLRVFSSLCAYLLA